MTTAAPPAASCSSLQPLLSSLKASTTTVVIDLSVLKKQVLTEAAIFTTKNTSVLLEKKMNPEWKPTNDSIGLKQGVCVVWVGEWGRGGEGCLSGQSMAPGLPTKAHTSLLLLLLLETGSSCLSFLKHQHPGSVNSLNSSFQKEMNRDADSLHTYV